MNSLKTHPSANGKYRAIHSELAAIMNLKRTGIDLSKTIMYNVRIGASGILLSRPCQDCSKLIIAANFKRVYYSNNFGLLEEYKYK
jgi:deoxycytidylate deaminase